MKDDIIYHEQANIAIIQGNGKQLAYLFFVFKIDNF